MPVQLMDGEKKDIKSSLAMLDLLCMLPTH